MNIPIDICIALALIAYGLGALTLACIRPRGHRLPSTAYFNRRNDTEPKLREWTPDHAKGAR